MMRQSRKRLLIGLITLVSLRAALLLPFRLLAATVIISTAIGSACVLVVLGRGLAIVWKENQPRRRKLAPQLPYVPNLLTIRESAPLTPALSGKYYRVYVSDTGAVELRDSNGDPLVTGIQYYSQTDLYEVLGMQQASWEIQPTRDGAILTVVGRVDAELVRLEYYLEQDRPTIKVQAQVVYSDAVRVRRSALVWDIALPLSEVYRPGGTRITQHFENSYWLDRQGALFGHSSCGVFVNHVPRVSSLQVDTGRQRLWVNLDYERDHPNVSIPFLQDGSAKWSDASASAYRPGQERRNELVVTVGEIPALRPRIVCHPHGHLASFAWTEHACHTSLDAHRAVYFGRQDIERPEDAIAGFVRHHIPVTKSVHYSNVTEIPAVSSEQHDFRPMVSIRSYNSDFLHFLDALHRLGNYDIGLHCTDPVSSEREHVEQSLQFMQERFRATTWIDHIWCRQDGTVGGCREAISCEGALPDSIGYIGDLWQRYGTQHFWNNSFEYMLYDKLTREPITVASRAGRGFRNVLTFLRRGRLWRAGEEFWRYLLGPGQGIPAASPSTSPLKTRENNMVSETAFYSLTLAARSCGFPTPRYYQHPTQTGHCYHWPTFDCESGPRPAAEWNAVYSETELERFVDSGETYLAHAYPTWADRANSCIYTDSTGTCSISPEFDSVLARMARLRNEGTLYLGTIEKLIGHWRRLELVELSYQADGSVHITNHGEEPIEGFTLAFDSSSVDFGISRVTVKPSRGDWLYCFNLPANGRVVVRMLNLENTLRRSA